MEGDWREEKPEHRARQEEIVHICQADGNPILRGEKAEKNGREMSTSDGVDGDVLAAYTDVDTAGESPTGPGSCSGV